MDAPGTRFLNAMHPFSRFLAKSHAFRTLSAAQINMALFLRLKTQEQRSPFRPVRTGRSAMRGLIAITALAILGSAAMGQPSGLPDGVEVQASGPIHEAFAQPTAPRQEPSEVIAKKPP